MTLSSLLATAGERPVPAAAGGARVRPGPPLSDAELAALWPLVVLRAASLMVSGQHQASIDSDNDYATENLDREWRIFEVATSVPLDGGDRAPALGCPPRCRTRRESRARG